MNERIEKLKTKWGVRKNSDFILIILVFALTGVSVLFFKRILYSIPGVCDIQSDFLKIVVYIFTIPPMYMLLLWGYGMLLGQQLFFNYYLKKMLSRFGIKK